MKLRPASPMLLAALLVGLEVRAISASTLPVTTSWIGFLPSPLLLLGSGLLFSETGRWRWWTILGTSWSLLLSIDRVYLSFFHQPVSFELSLALGQVWQVRESVAALLSPLDLLLPLATLLIGLWGVRAARLAPRPPRRGLAIVVLAAGAVTLAMTSPSDALGPYHLHDAAGALLRQISPPVLPPERREAVVAALRRREQLNELDSPLLGVARGRNVVMLQLESFSGRLLGLAVEGGDVTPFLNGLARRGISFRRCLDTTKLGRTSDAEFQALNGLRPHSFLPVAFSHVDHDYVTVPDVLKARGYATWSLHGFQPDVWNMDVTHPHYGIDRPIFEDSFAAGYQVGWGLGDADFLTQAAPMLSSAPEPFFAFLVTLSSHHPFRKVPARTRDWPVGLPESSMLSGYLRLAHYTDEAVGSFVRLLTEQGLAERTLLVIYGDHDPGLDRPSQGEFARLAGFDPNEAPLVPLLIVMPGAEGTLARERLACENVEAGQDDIAPTILHLLGEDIPLGMYGTHLFVPADRREPFLSPHGEQQLIDDILDFDGHQLAR